MAKSKKTTNEEQPCPNCGYCPTCGQARYQPPVTYVWPPYIWQPNTITVWGGTDTAAVGTTNHLGLVDCTFTGATLN